MSVVGELSGAEQENKIMFSRVTLGEKKRLKTPHDGTALLKTRLSLSVLKLLCKEEAQDRTVLCGFQITCTDLILASTDGA